MQAVDSARLPRTFFDIRDMADGYARNGYPYTPPVGLINGLNWPANACWPRGWNMSCPPRRIAGGCAPQSRPGADALRRAPALYSDSVSAIRMPEGFRRQPLCRPCAGNL